MGCTMGVRNWLECFRAATVKLGKATTAEQRTKFVVANEAMIRKFGPRADWPSFPQARVWWVGSRMAA